MASIKSDFEIIYKKPNSGDDSIDIDKEDDAVNLQYSEQDEFLDKYGAYVEMIYIITNGDMLKLDEVTKLPARQFLFLAEYLIEKRRIEAKKNNN